MSRSGLTNNQLYITQLVVTVNTLPIVSWMNLVEATKTIELMGVMIIQNQKKINKRWFFYWYEVISKKNEKFWLIKRLDFKIKIHIKTGFLGY